jgi:glycosyltransferase involved in cell wall biosynthesis
MSKHYIFFTRNVLPQPNAAHLVQVTHSANAAANLGYSTVLVYLRKGAEAVNPGEWLYPFRPKSPNQELAKFYNLQEKLKVAPLPVPWPFDVWGNKWTNSSTLVSKFYFPLYILPKTKIVHSRDWNFVKAAIQRGVPAIYEHHHHEQKRFEPEIVHSPLFQIAVTVADTIRDSMIQNGMPPEKVIQLHNGINRLFLIRQPEQAETWRKQLLKDERQHLVVYAGALHPFKGIDLLMDVAQALPQIQFALAGGDASQVQHYQQLAKAKQVENMTFLGYLLQDQLASLLQAANVLAHPHCSGAAATFTSPLKLFDYLASGTPIVATEISSLTEFKSLNLISGWCEPDNPIKFAESIQQVIANFPRKVEGYGDSLDLSQFSWENRITKILSYVDESMRPAIIDPNSLTPV